MHPFLDHPRPLAIAHRGGSLEAEENTMPAFAHAVGLGYSHIELDVHATKDGEVVIHHDPTLQRMTGDPRAIADLSYAELAQVRTLGGAAIPRLADLLEEHPETHLNIETKSDAVIAPFARLVTQTGSLRRLGTGSFNPARTRRLQSLLGEGLCWSPAHLGVAGLWLKSWHLPWRSHPFAVVQVPPNWHGIPLVTRRFVETAHRQGILVQVWTVDDEAQMHQLLDIGVDGIMSDRPSLLKQVLIERNQWKGPSC
ncbi:glycerophosphodiester phosphodiesterase [Pararhodobacter oceanensis]|uniref:glycerophosphodiester phosphodiesterase n=1 Tax=Pararhodobacter oceanensis TaxID=2172121 RepID=UPI003A9195A9